MRASAPLPGQPFGQAGRQAESAADGRVLCAGVLALLHASGETSGKFSHLLYLVFLLAGWAVRRLTLSVIVRSKRVNTAGLELL